MTNYRMEEMAYELNVASAHVAKHVAEEVSVLTPDKPRFAAAFRA